MDPGMRDNSSSVEETSNEKRGLYGDVLGKWRSCEQVDNGTPSTSPSYEDSEDDDGTKPSALYNKFTWKIEKFSTIDTRELRSPAYDAGGYKWYILIYPQGCDVSNHLSLFLCVANHDKFLPGWSHFAQFTIAVVNKDINKSKYSDTLHRFWKKEHDWGWKKFMELSKLSDGFIIDDTLVIDAQVQVIRENAHRPFRCLDHEYRRELVRVYSSNVEQICRRFFEDRRGRLSKLIEDKLRWSSFRVFWLGINQNVRRRMSRDTTEAILKLVVKHFFIEKEVTSTLVMDSLYYGLRALEGQSLQTKDGKSGGGGKPAVVVESQVPMVCIEKDMFVLAADVLLLLERAALAPHQPLLLKDEKASHNRTKDGSSGEEFYKDIIERDERRFTELGLRTLELFILIHIFSRIEVAYNEVVALKRQEELIREEEAAGQLENELRAKRLASEKEKRTKKKQAKQKRNARKGKDRGKDEKPETAIQKHHTSGPSNGKILDHEKPVAGKIETETQEDASDDGSDAGDDAPESLKPEIEVHLAVSHEIQNGVEREKRITSLAIDDSCSTCSTGSASSVVIVMNGAQKGISLPSDKRRTSRIRAKDHTREQICSTHGGNNPSSDSASAENSLVSQTEPAAAVVSKDHIQHPAEKEEKEVETIIRDRIQEKLLSKSRISPPSPAKKPPSAPQQSKKSSETTTTTTFATTHEPVSSTPAQNEKSAPLATKSPPPTTKTSYVQEEKEVETIIRDRLQEEFLSKSRISPTSPAKKPPSAPQQPKKSSETTTTTFATTHVPVSSTSSQNEKSAPLGTKSPPPTTATTATKTSYVQEEKEVETIIRDRPQEELLSKSRISPPSPAKKPSSAPQQPKKSSETTTTTFTTTHEPVSSTPAQNEKSSPLGTKSPPPTTATTTTTTTTTKTEAKKLTTSLPRPLSAPLVDSPRPTASIVSTVQTSPLLSRSVSSAARLGTDLPTAAPSSLPQSTRNPVSSTTSGSGPLACSTSSTEPTSYPQSPSRVRNSLPNSRHGLGPALPESLSGLRDGLSVQLATAGEVSDEFPHLDIINDLLDEDQTASVKSQFRPYFERQYTFPRDVATTSDIGSSIEGFRGPHGYSGGGPLNGPRDSQTAQMEPSIYAGGRIDGARRSRWPYRASVLNSGSEDDDGNPFQTRDYGNGYNMF